MNLLIVRSACKDRRSEGPTLSGVSWAGVEQEFVFSPLRLRRRSTSRVQVSRGLRHEPVTDSNCVPAKGVESNWR